MTFSNPDKLKDQSALIPPVKFSNRIAVPWTQDEQQAIRWLDSAPTEQLSASQRRMKGQPACSVVKSLSASQLKDLVKRWKSARR